MLERVRALAVVVVLEALMLAVVVVVYIQRESSPTRFPAVVTVATPAAFGTSVPVSYRAGVVGTVGIVGRTKHVAFASRGGQASAVQP
jgi:cation transport ATPase